MNRSPSTDNRRTDVRFSCLPLLFAQMHVFALSREPRRFALNAIGRCRHEAATTLFSRGARPLDYVLIQLISRTRLNERKTRADSATVLALNVMWLPLPRCGHSRCEELAWVAGPSGALLTRALQSPTPSITATPQPTMAQNSIHSALLGTIFSHGKFFRRFAFAVALIRSLIHSHLHNLFPAVR